MSKNILLTNHELCSFTGSEIDTMSIAIYFVKIGYNVTIFTINYGNPIKELIDENKIKVVTYDEANILGKHYDLVWAHHYPLLDYLIFHEKIIFDKIVYAALSSTVGLEAAPDYSKFITYVLANSLLTKNVLLQEGVSDDKLIIFPNYAPQEYFKRKINVNSMIKKICIVSNHMQNELIEASELLKKMNIVVDIYGWGNNEVFINDYILSRYDLIISIGKTVNYGLALGIPVYCYDVFGGPGYINKENYQKAYEHIFSGKPFNRKLTGEEIANEIKKEYTFACKNVEYLRKLAYKDFCFENNMINIIKSIDKSENVDMIKIKTEYFQITRKTTVFLDHYNFLAKNRNHINNLINDIELLKENVESINNIQIEKDIKINQLTEELKSFKNGKLYIIAQKIYRSGFYRLIRKI